MVKQLVALAAAGALGTLSRYVVGGLVHMLCGEKFPWGTLTVNAVGCFLFGLVWTLAEQRLVISGPTRIVLLTGFMGAFTTFSTFAFETGEFLRDSEWMLAALNLLGHNLLGITCVLAGFALGRWL